MTMVFKLLHRADYDRLLVEGAFDGSADDIRDGFIHLSAADQWAATRDKYFADADELWLLGCDAAALGPDLRWEVSRGGAMFPHLYRPLRATDVVSAVAL